MGTKVSKYAVQLAKDYSWAGPFLQREEIIDKFSLSDEEFEEMQEKKKFIYVDIKGHRCYPRWQFTSKDTRGFFTYKYTSIAFNNLMSLRQDDDYAVRWLAAEYPWDKSKTIYQKLTLSPFDSDAIVRILDMITGENGQWEQNRKRQLEKMKVNSLLQA